jgi:hypothetical protein
LIVIIHNRDAFAGPATAGEKREMTTVSEKIDAKQVKRAAREDWRAHGRLPEGSAGERRATWKRVRGAAQAGHGVGAEEGRRA